MSGPRNSDGSLPLDTVATDETEPARTLPRDGRPLQRGDVVGRYVVLSRLGAGGMGVVFAGYDPELDRKVALKLLLPHADRSSGTRGRSRLVREAQAMAKLHHPNVVAVHDVGTVGGRVYVAMEFIDGVTLSEWITKEDLDARRIVALFVRVARGLAAAHAAEIVHRDFKPDNVMVGNDGRVCVMDFGLAQTAGRMPSSSQPTTAPEGSGDKLTRTGAVMGTPAYMAPEQHLGLPTDARSDQFSFCVALWEALYGERPYAGDTLAAVAFAVVQGKRRPPPRRSHVPRWVHAILERGLDTKAEGRFPSMEDLISALLLGQARARRRKALTVFGAAGLLVAAGYGAHQLDLQQRNAECFAEGQRIVETWNDSARDRVRTAFTASRFGHAATTADKVMPWLDAQASAWHEARTEACLNVAVRKTWDRDTLERASWCLDERRLELASLVAELVRADDSAINRSVRAAATLSPIELCLDDVALKNLPAPPTPEAREVARSVQKDLARAAALSAAGKYTEALGVTSAAATDAVDLGWPPLVADARQREGELLRQQGSYPQAEATSQEAYMEAAKAQSWAMAAEAAYQLVFVVGDAQARIAEAETWAAHAEVAAALAGDPLRLHEASRLTTLAHVRHRAGDLEAAKALDERALAISEATLGATHPSTALNLHNLALVVDEMGEYAEAKALLERTLDIWEATLGAEHPTVAHTLNALANVESSRGQYTEARALYVQALGMMQKTLGYEHPAVAVAVGNLAVLHYETGDYEQAKAVFQRAIAMQEQTLGPEQMELAINLGNLANVQRILGNLQEARALHERSLGLKKKALGPDHFEVGVNLGNLGNVLRDMGDLAGAKAAYESARGITSRALGPDHPSLSYLLYGLADVALQERRPADAIAPATRAVAIREAAGGSAKRVASSRFMLARALWEAPKDQGRDRARALQLAEQARDGYRDEHRDAQLAEVEAWLAKHTGAP